MDAKDASSFIVRAQFATSPLMKASSPAGVPSHAGHPVDQGRLMPALAGDGAPVGDAQCTRDDCNNFATNAVHPV